MAQGQMYGVLLQCVRSPIVEVDDDIYILSWFNDRPDNRPPYD